LTRKLNGLCVFRAAQRKKESNFTFCILITVSTSRHRSLTAYVWSAGRRCGGRRWPLAGQLVHAKHLRALNWLVIGHWSSPTASTVSIIPIMNYVAVKQPYITATYITQCKVHSCTLLSLYLWSPRLFSSSSMEFMYGNSSHWLTHTHSNPIIITLHCLVPLWCHDLLVTSCVRNNKEFPCIGRGNTPMESGWRIESKESTNPSLFLWKLISRQQGESFTNYLKSTGLKRKKVHKSYLTQDCVFFCQNSLLSGNEFS
jgi:hypothetical protein